MNPEYHIRQKLDHFGCFLRGHHLAIEGLGQTATLNEFHREKWSAGVFANFMDMDNIGVLELGQRLSLGPKTQ